MSIAELLALITALAKFPSVILEFVKILQKTPEEKHEDLLKKIAEESIKFQETGRPTWS